MANLIAAMDSDMLKHYGTMGMKWGIRKDRRSARRQVRQDAKQLKKVGDLVSNKKAAELIGNTFTDKPKNARISNAQLKTIIDRIELEQKYARLTHVPQQPPSRVKRLMQDVAYDVSKGALTEVGKAVLSQALKVEFNKRASQPYKVDVKQVASVIDAVKK